MPRPSQFTLCHEKWEDMTPAARGRLCAKCDRVLIDFTGMSEDEIRAYHLRNPGTCGLYSLSQFHRPGSRIAAAAAAAAIGLTVPTAVHAMVQATPSGITQSEIAPVDTVLVNGTVVDSISNRPLAGVQVFVVGTRVGAITDHHGQFRFALRDSVTFPLRVQAQYIGYGTEEILVASIDSLANLSFTLSPTAIGIVGIVVTGEPRPLVPKDEPSFWQRVWRFLLGR